MRAMVGGRSSLTLYNNFLVSRIPDDGKVQKTSVILCVIHHRQNPSECNQLFTFSSVFVFLKCEVSFLYFFLIFEVK
jgi:hypothetical protein